MAIAQPAPSTLRPECVKHPGSRIRLDGFVASNWNKIEHRLFSAITMNWRGKQ